MQGIYNVSPKNPGTQAAKKQIEQDKKGAKSDFNKNFPDMKNKPIQFSKSYRDFVNTGKTPPQAIKKYNENLYSFVQTYINAYEQGTPDGKLNKEEFQQILQDKGFDKQDSQNIAQNVLGVFDRNQDQGLDDTELAKVITLLSSVTPSGYISSSSIKDLAETFKVGPRQFAQNKAIYAQSGKSKVSQREFYQAWLTQFEK